ncbi:hypothetical protein B0T09DRAFT_322729 [Sordaria sp. MPI-SDFR-AT-0083]|nr:hypothetical protein B0T09DRAFT_322729 [Sordaria sp. MPI-SDFR-AT-0083]
MHLRQVLAGTLASYKDSNVQSRFGRCLNYRGVPRLSGSGQGTSGQRPFFKFCCTQHFGELVYLEKYDGVAARLAREARTADLITNVPQHWRFSRGGYGVVFRRPYHGERDFTEYDKNNDNQTQYIVRRPEDASSTKDFNIASWPSRHALSMLQANMAAVFHL